MKRTMVLVLALGGAAFSEVPDGASADTSGGRAPLRVSFKCTQSNVALYQWQFNYDGTNFLPDSSSDTSGDVSYVYTEPGTYYARVQWYDASSGETDGQTLGPIRVLAPPRPPVVTSSFGPLPVSVIVGTEPHAVTFSATAIPSLGRSIVSYTWDIHGDGAIDASTPGGPTSTVSLSYSVAGYYTYTVTAVDDQGLAGTDRKTVRVGAPPALSLNVDPAIGEANLLSGDATPFQISIAPSAVSTIVTAQINYGDGTIEPLLPDAATVPHTYAGPGSYTVTLGATDDMGYSATSTLAVTVRNPPIITRLDSVSQAKAGAAGTFVCDARTTAPATITSYSWTLSLVQGDNPPSPIAAISGPGSTVSFSFTSNGTYRVAVQATDSVGRVSPAVATNFNVSGIGGSSPPNIGKQFPPPAKVSVASVWEGDSNGKETGGQHTTSTPGTILRITIRVGHRVTFQATGQQGQFPLANFGWDLDGDHLLDVLDSVGVGTSQATSTQKFQYETAGVYVVECAVGDQNPDRSTSILARQRFIVTVLPVRPDDTSLQGWISQPRNGKRIWGNHVSVKARTSPASQTGSVEFQYRAAGTADWTSIGTVVPPPYVCLSIPWDVSGLTPGPYDLRALATSKSGGTPWSSESIQPVRVIVDPVDPEVEENGEIAGLPAYRHENVDPNLPTTTEISGSTSVEIPPHGARIPPGGVSIYFRMRLSLQDQDPHPLETKFQKLHFIPGTFRSLSLNNGATLSEPSRVTLYNTREAVSTYLAQLGLNARNTANPSLSIYQFDTESGRWVPLFAQVQQPEADLVRASTVSMGDIALAVDVTSREASSSGESTCGLLGLEGLALLLLARLRRRRQSPPDPS